MGFVRLLDHLQYQDSIFAAFNMIIRAVGTLILPAMVFASPEQMQEDLTGLFKNSSSMRVFAGTIANSIEGLDGYGCWCYFYNRHGKGKSQPVDDVDAFCKILHQGYAVQLSRVKKPTRP